MPSEKTKVLLRRTRATPSVANGFYDEVLGDRTRACRSGLHECLADGTENVQADQLVKGETLL